MKLLVSSRDQVNNQETTKSGGPIYVEGRLAEGLVEGLAECQKKIVKLIWNNPDITKKEMSESIGISTTAVDKNITALKNKNIIVRVGSDKGGSWQIIKP